MDKKDALDIAEKYADAVKSKYDFVKIILFGSYAKGNFNEDSDIDIAVILKDYNNLLDIQLDLMWLRRKIDSRIKPHPYRERDFDITNPMVYEIVKQDQELKINAAWNFTYDHRLYVNSISEQYLSYLAHFKKIALL